MTNKILKIIPFYGTWPSYMNLYLDSCKNNQIIDIVFVTDLKPHKDSPSNVQYFYLSFDDLKKRIANIFGLDLLEIVPYKLCDFRPAYGIIFKDLIIGYDFWGYGDNDLIYGDLSKFLTSEILRKNDIIAFRPDHLHGPFTLYKNTEFINNLFRRGNYIKIFKNQNYLSFDEFGSNNFLLLNQKSIDELPNTSISVISLKAKQNNELNLYLNLHCKEKICETNEIIKYDTGNVINQRTKEQYSFYHWVIEKRATYFKYPNWEVAPSIYYVSSTGFYTETQFNNYKFIHLFRKSIGILYWYFLRFKNFPLRRMGIKIKIDTYPRLGFIKINT